MTDCGHNGAQKQRNNKKFTINYHQQIFLKTCLYLKSRQKSRSNELLLLDLLKYLINIKEETLYGVCAVPITSGAPVVDRSGRLLFTTNTSIMVA